MAILHPTGSEEFAGELERLGVPAPWHISDEAVIAANGEVACIAGHEGVASDDDRFALAMYIIIAVNTMAGFKAVVS